MTHKPNLAELRVIAITVDHKRITLYDEQGETYTLQQGDPRIPPIMEHALPLVKQHKVAIISLVPPEQTHYQDIEKNSSGLVKLFRVAKSKIKTLFSEETKDKKVTIKNGGAAPIPTPKEATQHDPVAEVMKHAIPASSPDFNQPEKVSMSYDPGSPNGDSTTVCAMVDGVIIPGIENLERYLQRASSLGSYDGILAFLKRIAAVINDRSHSIEDLLRFLERADLPIADDGSIVIYKILRRKANMPGYYVDCHTGNVIQRVGSHVCMDPKLVDPDRRNECSNGLHVARRAYINNFGGDVCTVAKLAPEDVIAVPNHDANKMRVCGYHILEELSPDMYQQLKLNKPMTELESGKRMLGRVLAGNHIGKIERVTIRGQRGNDLLIEQLDSEGNVTTPVTDQEYSAEALPDKGEEVKAPPVDFNQINQEKASPFADENEEELSDGLDAGEVCPECEQLDDNCECPDPTADEDIQPETESMELTFDEWMRRLAIATTRKERIAAWLGAFDAPDTSNVGKQMAAAELRKEKQQAKTGYQKLGIDISKIEPYFKTTEAKKVEQATKTNKAKPIAATAKKSAYSQMTNKEKTADLWLDFQTAPDAATRKQAAIALSNFKREKKVSWEKLGLDGKEVEKKIKHLL